MTTPTLDQHPELTNVCMIAHAVNKAWVDYSLGGSSPAWADTDDDTKESIANGVLFVINNPEATDEETHANWVAGKEAQGWKYGPDKDADAKTHPALLPYDALPRWRRFQDELFRTVVRSSLG